MDQKLKFTRDACGGIISWCGVRVLLFLSNLSSSIVTLSFELKDFNPTTNLEKKVTREPVRLRLCGNDSCIATIDLILQLLLSFNTIRRVSKNWKGDSIWRSCLELLGIYRLHCAIKYVYHWCVLIFCFFLKMYFLLLMCTRSLKSQLSEMVISSNTKTRIQISLKHLNVWKIDYKCSLEMVTSKTSFAKATTLLKRNVKGSLVNTIREISKQSFWVIIQHLSCTKWTQKAVRLSVVFLLYFITERCHFLSFCFQSDCRTVKVIPNLIVFSQDCILLLMNNKHP